MDLYVKRLSSGYWHISGDGPCEWAQPPTWPCDEMTLLAHTFPQASAEFFNEMLRRMERNSDVREVCVLTPEETSARDAKRLEVKEQKIAAAEARFQQTVDSGEWERECAAEARRPAFGPRVEEKSQ